MSRKELVRFLNRTVAFKAKKVAGGGTNRKEWCVVAVCAGRTWGWDAVFSNGAGGWYRGLTPQRRSNILPQKTAMFLARLTPKSYETKTLNDDEVQELEIIDDWDYFPMVNANVRGVVTDYKIGSDKHRSLTKRNSQDDKKDRPMDH